LLIPQQLLDPPGTLGTLVHGQPSWHWPTGTRSQEEQARRGPKHDAKQPAPDSANVKFVVARASYVPQAQVLPLVRGLPANPRLAQVCPLGGVRKSSPPTAHCDTAAPPPLLAGTVPVPVLPAPAPAHAAYGRSGSCPLSSLQTTLKLVRPASADSEGGRVPAMPSPGRSSPVMPAPAQVTPKGLPAAAV
jgi:hypothetical protein